MHKRKIEFSKIMAVIAVVMWLVVNIYGLIMMAITLDLSPMAYVIGSVDAAFAVVLGFYYSKAKSENQIKLRKIYGEDADAVMRNGY